MKVHCSTRLKIIRLGKCRFRLWRIVQETGLTPDDVLEVLVDAGIVRLSMVELTKKRGAK